MPEAVFVAGDDITLTITATDAAGTAINLTGATISYSLRKKNDDSIAVTKTTSDDVTITDAANGIFTVDLADTDTTSLFGLYETEAKVTDSGGDISRLRDSNIDPVEIRFNKKIIS